MKKYLKMLGLIIIYAALPLAIDFTLVYLLKDVKLLKAISSVTPTIFFGIFDPISIIALFLFVKTIRKKNPLVFSDFKKTTASNLIICALLGILMGAFTFSLMNIDYVKINIPQLGGTIGFIIGGNLFLLIYIIAVNSLYKEFCFRGLIFNELRLNVPITVAIICQAMVYGLELLAQSDSFTALYGFAGQILFGMIFYFGRSIWTSITAQIACTLGMAIINQTALKSIFNSQRSIFIFPLSIILVITMVLVLYRNNKNQLRRENTGFAATH